MKKISVKLNFIFNAILSITKFVFPLITYPYVARVLGAEGTGKVSFATSLIYYFIMFAELGIPTYGVRKCATVRDDKEKLSRTVHELLIIQTITSIISFIALFVCMFTVPKLCSEKLLYLVVSSAIIFHLVGMEWLYKAVEQYQYIAVRSMLFKLIAIIAMFLMIRDQDDYIIYGGIGIFAASGSYVCNLLKAKSLISFKPMGGYNLKQHMKPVLIFFAMACAVSIYTHIDTIMLGFMSGDTVVGYYNAAVKIKTIMVGLTTSLSVVLLPKASYYVKQNKLAEFEKIARKSINFSVLFTLPVVIYFILYANYAIDLLAGAEYVPAIFPMRIIMPTVLIVGLSYPIGMQMLVPLGKEKYVLISEIAGAVVNIIVNALLIPRFEAAGAAVGTVIAELTVLVVQYFSVRKTVPNIFSNVKLWKTAAATVGGTAASVWLLFSGFGSFVALALSACLFFGVYGLILILLKESLVKDIIDQFLGKLKKKTKTQN